MFDSHQRRLFLIALPVVVILAGALYLAATPLAPPLSAVTPNTVALGSASSTQPKISWSPAHLVVTMFPGSSLTVTVTVLSDQNLGAVAIGATPSLGGIASVSPRSFDSVAVDQPYPVTLTLTAPPEFIKESFEGTIHVRNTEGGSSTYATPLPVTLQTDWNTVSPDGLFAINLPLGWRITEVPSSGAHTFTVELPDGTPVGWLFAYTPQQWTAIQQAEESPVLLLQAGGLIYAYGDSEALSPDEMSSGTEFRHALSSFQAH